MKSVNAAVANRAMRISSTLVFSETGSDKPIVTIIIVTSRVEEEHSKVSQNDNLPFILAVARQEQEGVVKTRSPN